MCPTEFEFSSLSQTRSCCDCLNQCIPHTSIQTAPDKQICTSKNLSHVTHLYDWCENEGKLLWTFSRYVYHICGTVKIASEESKWFFIFHTFPVAVSVAPGYDGWFLLLSRCGASGVSCSGLLDISSIGPMGV